MAFFNQTRVKNLVHRKQAKMTEHNFLHDFMMESLMDRLNDFDRNFENIHIHSMPQKIHSEHTSPQDFFEDAPSLDVSAYDAYISCGTLNFCNELETAMFCLLNSLKSDGVLLGAVLGGETLTELHQCILETEGEIYNGHTPRIHPMLDSQDVAGLLQTSDFKLPVVDKETLNVQYDDVFHLIKDLRTHGLTNSLNNKKITSERKSFFKRVDEIYKEKFGVDNKIPTTFEVIFFTGWRDHESQQKPLRPGSGKKSLTDVL